LTSHCFVDIAALIILVMMMMMMSFVRFRYNGVNVNVNVATNHHEKDEHDDDEHEHALYVTKIPIIGGEEEAAAAAVLSPVHRHRTRTMNDNGNGMNTNMNACTHILAILLGHIIILVMIGSTIYMHTLALSKLFDVEDGNGSGGICDRNTYFPNDIWYDKYPLQYYREYAYFKFFAHCALGKEGLYSMTAKHWNIVAFVTMCVSLLVSLVHAGMYIRARTGTGTGITGTSISAMLDEKKSHDDATVRSNSSTVMDQFPLEVEGKTPSRSIMVGMMTMTTMTKDDATYTPV